MLSAKLLLISTLVGLTGCAVDNEAGSCVGFLTQDQKRPGVVYETKEENAIMGILLTSFGVLPGLLVFGYGVECPKEGSK